MCRLFVLLTILPFCAFAQARDPLPVPGSGPYRVLKCDFHMHTVFSDGEVWPMTRVQEAWRDGLDAIALTDHAGYNPHKPDVPADVSRPYAIARQAAERAGITLVPAVEIAEGNLHFNALFVKDANAFFNLKLADALRVAREQDAFVFWNHPGWKETAQWFPPVAAGHDARQIQGVELVNGRTFYKEAFPWIEEKNLTILANSDVHSPMAAEQRSGRRPITLVFAKTAGVEGIREALLARRTAAWMGGEVWGSAELLRGLWEGGVKVLNADLRFEGSRGPAALRVHNTSAIPFRLHVAKSPAWLTVRAADIPEERMAAMAVNVSKASPEGTTPAQVEIEITNFHISPGQNLVVSVPLSVTSARASQ